VQAASHPTKPRLLVIAGPTASGKTALAVEVCKRLQGEIISADSMQVYKHLSVGTAKPTAAELQGVPCHLIDHVEPDEQYNLGRFVDEARHTVMEIHARGNLPVICGGTGMYIRGLLHGVFQGGEPALEIRHALEAEEQSSGLPALFAKLEAVDAESARRYGPNDRQRIIRALEIFYATGKPLSEYHTQDLDQPDFAARIYVIRWPRQMLYDRINKRAEAMLQNGLLDEIARYLASGYEMTNPAVNALGYREMIDVLRGQQTREVALDVMQRKSRNYAKRQETWFRAVHDAVFLYAEGTSVEMLAEQVVSDWEKSGI